MTAESSLLARAVPPVLELLPGLEGRQRRVVCGFLAALGPDAAVAVPTLCSLLEEDDSANWAIPLGEIGPAARSAVPALCRSLLRRKEQGRWGGRAAAALVLIGDESAVPALVEAATVADHYCLNEWIQVEFDERGREATAAVGVLLRLLDAPVFADHRYWILSWIGQYHTPGGPGLPALKRVLASNPEDHIRRAAAGGLRAALQVERDNDPELIGLLESCSSGKGCASGAAGAAHKLIRGQSDEPTCRARRGYIRDYQRWHDRAQDEATGLFAGVVPLLVEVALNGTLDQQRRALHALAVTGPDAAPAQPALREVLARTTSAAVCDDVAVVLAASGPAAEQSVPALADLILLRHPAGDEEAAERAALALGCIRSPSALAVLVEALRTSRDDYLIDHALGAVGRFRSGGGAAVPVLHEMLEDERHARRTGDITKTLARIQPGVKEADLLLALAERHPRLKHEIADRLYRLLWDEKNGWGRSCSGEEGPPLRADPRLPDFFKERFQPETPDGAAWYVIGALGLLGLAETVDPLLGLFHRSADDHQRARILEALALIGRAAPEVIQAFRQALGDESHYVRSAAAGSLPDLGEAARELLPLVEEQLAAGKLSLYPAVLDRIAGWKNAEGT